MSRYQTDTEPEPRDWRLQAKCRGHLGFTELPDPEAKAYCTGRTRVRRDDHVYVFVFDDGSLTASHLTPGQCPVLPECREFGIATAGDSGVVFGGLTNRHLRNAHRLLSKP